jgi:uncharacterized protein (DUF1684 family)
LSVGRLQLIYRLPADLEHRVFVSDPQIPNSVSFHGLDWYAVVASWRIPGRLVPHQSAQKISYDNALGGSNPAESPADVVFTKSGREYRLQAANRSYGLMVLFSDGSSGENTLGEGRYLEIEKGDGDAVTLDFNQAVNPPCEANPYTECSLAPSQNRLPFEVAAGEKLPRIHVARVAAASKRMQ